MAAVLEIAEGIGRLAASMTSFAAATGDERARLLVRWREHVREGEAGLQREAVTFEDIYRDAVQRNLGSSEVANLAAVVLDERQEAAARIEPAVTALRRAARSAEPELLHILGRSLEIARGTLDNFDRLHGRLLALAQERAGSGKVHRARPLAGEIDYAELSREHIARYPKIRAALAK